MQYYIIPKISLLLSIYGFDFKKNMQYFYTTYCFWTKLQIINFGKDILKIKGKYIRIILKIFANVC